MDEKCTSNTNLKFSANIRKGWDSITSIGFTFKNSSISAKYTSRLGSWVIKRGAADTHLQESSRKHASGRFSNIKLKKWIK